MISDYVTDPHGVQFTDPYDGYPGVCRRPRTHDGDCAVAALATDLTLDETIAWMNDLPANEPTRRVAEFAADCRRMIESLSVASFPLPPTISISVGGSADDDPRAELVLTEGTARLLHAALGAALGIPNPRRLASE